LFIADTSIQKEGGEGASNRGAFEAVSREHPLALFDFLKPFGHSADAHFEKA